MRSPLSSALGDGGLERSPKQSSAARFCAESASRRPAPSRQWKVALGHSDAADQLEIGPTTLFRKVKRFGDGPWSLLLVEEAAARVVEFVTSV